MKKSGSDKAFNTFSHILMMTFAILCILPLILLLTSSFTDNNTLLNYGYSFFPRKWSLSNYGYILQNSQKIFSAYGVSILLTVVGTTLGTLITVMLGYGVSRSEIPGRKIISFLLIFTMLFNGGLVPTYLVYTNILHVKNTFWGLLLPGLLMNGFNVMLVKSYFKTAVPAEIFEAAEIDGASEFRKFSSIALPLAVPIIATIALFIGMGYWNDWNNGYVYISTKTNLYSIQNLLNRMQQNLQFIIQNGASSGASTSDIPSEGIRMAISVLGIVPVMIVYPWMQRFFIKGITLGGVKG